VTGDCVAQAPERVGVRIRRERRHVSIGAEARHRQQAFGADRLEQGVEDAPRSADDRRNPTEAGMDEHAVAGSNTHSPQIVHEACAGCMSH
jgi:hypothetical protein